MDNLTFDPAKEMNTDRARSYIEKNEHFKVTPQKGRCFVFSNGLAKVDKDLETFCETKFEKDNNIDHKVRRKFREELKRNFKLFCELDYLIRQEYGGETEKHLQLILKYLDCYDSVKEEPIFDYVLVTVYTHLYMLGYGLHHAEELCLLTTMEMAPLSYLFYEVCLHAGIKASVVFINGQDVDDIGKSDMCIQRDDMAQDGCAAVYTEYADIDSAVDLLIYSPRKVQWNINRILVQESVYEKVIFALSAKGRKMGSDRPTHYVEAFETRRGTVAVTVGDVATPSDIVRIVTYRTVRELLTLLANEPVSHFLSIWSMNTAQADEIASKSISNYIWINGYADFDGPPEVALALYTAAWYSEVNSYFHSQKTRFSADWSALTWNDRKIIILDTMNEFPLDSDSELQQAYRLFENWKPKNPARMQSNKVTIVVDSPKPNTIISISKMSDILSALECLVRGYQVSLRGCSKFTKKIILAMNKKGIPIVATTRFLKESEDCDMLIEVKPHLSNKKVIQTSFGTMHP